MEGIYLITGLIVAIMVVEEHAREIPAMLGGLGKDLKSFQEDFQLVGKHLTNALNKFEDSRRRLDKFTFKLE